MHVYPVMKTTLVSHFTFCKRGDKLTMLPTAHDAASAFMYPRRCILTLTGDRWDSRQDRMNFRKRRFARYLHGRREAITPLMYIPSYTFIREKEIWLNYITALDENLTRPDTRQAHRKTTPYSLSQLKISQRNKETLIK